MSTPVTPDKLHEAPVRFQYDLRTMLALTALVAWLCGWAGASGIPILVALAALALIEGGCTQGTNLLGVLVRNLFAYFVVSVVFALVGFGLMCGENPTGWFGTTYFLYSPLEKSSDADEAVTEIRELIIAPDERFSIGPDVVHVDPSDDVPDPFADDEAVDSTGVFDPFASPDVDAEDAFVDPFAEDPQSPFSEGSSDSFGNEEANSLAVDVAIDSPDRDNTDSLADKSPEVNDVPTSEDRSEGMTLTSLLSKAVDSFRHTTDPFADMETYAISPSGPSTLSYISAVRAPLAFPPYTLWCVVALVIGHRVLVGRGRLAAYVLFWCVAAALVYPLLGSWTGGWVYPGWLLRIGFVSCRVFPLIPVLSVAGWAVLAGMLVLGRKSRPPNRCLTLHSPHCDHVVVSIGIGALCLLFGMAPTIYQLVQAGDIRLMMNSSFRPLATAVAGLLGAFVVSLTWLRRLHLPLILGGALTGLLAGMSLTVQLSPLCGLLLGLVGGMGMVGVAWILDAIDIEDPGGAIAICGTAGVWGTISWGIFVNPPAAIIRPVFGNSGIYFDDRQIILQLLGIAVSFVWVFGVSAVVFLAIRRIPWLLKQENPPAETSGESEENVG